MSDSDLEPLLRIRASREELARRQVAQQQQAVVQHHRLLHEKNVQLHHYLKWKKEQEVSLFEALTRGPISTSELFRYRTSMTNLVNRQQQLMAELDQQQAMTREAEKALDDAKANFIEMHRATEKCRELVDEEKELNELNHRLKEDDELDELALAQWVAGQCIPDHEAER